MKLLWQMLARDWRGGELAVLIAALILAVAMVSGISGFANALQGALRQESHSFLAADIAIRDARPLPEAWLDTARDRGLNVAETMNFTSMLFADDDGMVLASVKAVSDRYPLRGTLRLSQQPFGPPLEAKAGPERGSVFLEPRLFALLDLNVGDTVSIGEADFRIAAAIRGEPDRAGSFLGVGPRVMLHIDDIPGTGVIQPGSRVSYRQLYAGDSEAVASFEQFLLVERQDGQRLQSVESSQPAVGQALIRAERFLLLGGSLVVILASIAVGLAARRYAERHQNYVALLKSLGAQGALIRLLYASTLAASWLLALVVGWCLALALQWLALQAFADQLTVRPSVLAPRPYLVGGATALVCVGSFAWPSLARLVNVSPLRVLRSDMPVHSTREPADYLLGTFAVVLLMWWYSADLALTLVVLGGLATVVLVGGLLAFSMLRGSRALGMQAGSVWRLALASLQRHGWANALQLVVFAVAVMLILLLALLRGSLLDGWQQQLPDGAPNHFVLNLAPDEVDPVRQLMQSESISSEQLYPMLRGRIIEVAGETLPINGDGRGSEDGQSENRENGERRQREANFTWSADLPDGNELVAGDWWQAKGDAVVSVEEEFAERLGIRLGDTLGLRIGASALQVTVTSLRVVDWESFKPNFFMVFPPGLLEDYPVTYMTSFFLPPDKKRFLNALLKDHPTATVIEIDAIMAQLRTTLDQVSTAIELVLVMVLGAGALVLLAGVQSSGDVRLRESALLRALGAARGHILGGVLIEFLTLGLLSGVLAVVAAEGAFWGLQTFVLELEYLPTPSLWLPAILGSGVLIAALGLWSCRRVVRVAPAVVLREV